MTTLTFPLPCSSLLLTFLLCISACADSQDTSAMAPNLKPGETPPSAQYDMSLGEKQDASPPPTPIDMAVSLDEGPRPDANPRPLDMSIAPDMPRAPDMSADAGMTPDAGNPDMKTASREPFRMEPTPGVACMTSLVGSKNECAPGQFCCDSIATSCTSDPGKGPGCYASYACEGAHDCEQGYVCCATRNEKFGRRRDMCVEASSCMDPVVCDGDAACNGGFCCAHRYRGRTIGMCQVTSCR